MAKKLRKAMARRNARRVAMAETIKKARNPAAFRMPGSLKK